MTTTKSIAQDATPRPWRAGYLDETDRNERMVIRAEHVDGQPYVAICPAPIVGSHEANAALIVEAVNRYPALVAVLEDWYAMFRAGLRPGAEAEGLLERTAEVLGIEL